MNSIGNNKIRVITDIGESYSRWTELINVESETQTLSVDPKHRFDRSTEVPRPGSPES